MKRIAKAPPTSAASKARKLLMALIPRTPLVGRFKNGSVFDNAWYTPRNGGKRSKYRVQIMKRKAKPIMIRNAEDFCIAKEKPSLN